MRRCTRNTHSVSYETSSLVYSNPFVPHERSCRLQKENIIMMLMNVGNMYTY